MLFVALAFVIHGHKCINNITCVSMFLTFLEFDEPVSSIVPSKAAAKQVPVGTSPMVSCSVEK